MRVFYVFACLGLMIGNAAYVFAVGFSHSAVVQDQGYCILTPLAWIGKNVGFRNISDPLPFLSFFAATWVIVILLGLYIARKGASAFWALLLPPGLAIIAFLLSYFAGWKFGRY